MKFVQIRESLKLLYILIKNSFSSRNVADYYQEIGDDILGLNEDFKNKEKSLWLNCGYWKNARNYNNACEDLCLLMAKSGQFNTNDTLLDVGFGYGEQDLYWMEKYNLKKIVGINITPLHVKIAKERVHKHGLSHRIEYKNESAPYLNFENETFDKVSALESAFHFKTRNIFFKEAFRVLKPDGRIVLADMLPSPKENHNGIIKRLRRKWVSIPQENMYDRIQYKKNLEKYGFRDVEIISIAKYVYPGMAKFTQKRFEGIEAENIEIEISQTEIENLVGINAWKAAGITDYIIASAKK